MNENESGPNEIASPGDAWVPVKRRRRMLAAYVDFVLFSIPWGLLVGAIGGLLPEAQAGAALASLPVFIAAEFAVLRFWPRQSPGRRILGIESRGTEGALVVSRWQQDRETWWTMLFGVLALNEGAKLAVRWTTWRPPSPLFGVELSFGTSAVFSIATGCASCLIGALILRTVRWSALASLGLTAFSLASSWFSRPLLEGWIADYVTQRRTHQGFGPRPDEIEMMQSAIPLMFFYLPLAGAAWALLVEIRFQMKSRQEARPGDGAPPNHGT